MRPVTVSVGPLIAVNATSVAASQTPAAAGYLAINGSAASGGVASFSSAQQLVITTTDTTHSFNVVGTSANGTPVMETVGPVASGSATTMQNFLTVKQIYINGPATAAVTVGNSGAGATPPVRTDEWANSELSIQVNVSGTVNFTVQASNDDPNDPTNPVNAQNMTWINSNDMNAVGATAAILTNYVFAPRYVRVLLNSGTGSISATITQYNAPNQ